MKQISTFFSSEIQGNNGIIGIDEKDFINFSAKVNIKTFHLNYKLKEWLNKKKIKVQRLIICISIPEREIQKFKIGWITNILTIFVSVEKPIFGIYKNNKQKRIKITLIFE